MDRKQKLILGYGLMGVGAIIAGIVIGNIPTMSKIAILISAGIGFLGYKIRLVNR